MGLLRAPRLAEKRRLSVQGLLERRELPAAEHAALARKYLLYRAATAATMLGVVVGGGLLLRRRWPAPSRYLLREAAALLALTAAFQSARLLYIALLWASAREDVRRYAAREEGELRALLRKSDRRPPSAQSAALKA